MFVNLLLFQRSKKTSIIQEYNSIIKKIGRGVGKSFFKGFREKSDLRATRLFRDMLINGMAF